MLTQSALASVSPPIDNAAIEDLLRLSAEIGGNRLLVQASGGNTSVKVGETLWIKASGKWLAFACKDEMLVPIHLSRARDCLRQGKDLDCAIQSFRGQGQLRPSIETFMHAVLPHAVVAHVHSVNAIAWAVRADASARLAERLGGLRWQWVPYVPSGLPLARAVEAFAACDVLVLGNHGLVVCGSNCAETQALLDEVERRLAIQPRTAPESNRQILEQFQRSTSWWIPGCERLHSIATDPISRNLANSGILYPCQAIFLGREFPQLPCSSLNANPFWAVEGSGLLLHPEITKAEYAILEGFAEILSRISPLAPLRYLTQAEIDAAMGAESFQYRSAPDNRSPVQNWGFSVGSGVHEN
jgi:rhamnose utilization protein RhaD (predicted bifunctional aldolase and dehydrogenase)